MRFSVLHLSDLHRDLSNELENPALLESLDRDFARFDQANPTITKPAVCIVSGDLVHGISPTSTGAMHELERQYDQAEAFLAELADRFFGGNRQRIVLLPGNHDISLLDVMESVARIDIPADPAERWELVAELRRPASRLRWSWREFCFYRVTDEGRYRRRFDNFAVTYDRFYQGQRSFSLMPEMQYAVFDYPELGFSVLVYCR